MTVSIVIPTKNEEKNISEIIEKCKKFGNEIIIVDGHSSDKTRDIAQSLGAKVVFDHGKGKGDALKTSLDSLTGDIIVFIDADGSHEPEDIPKLIRPILANQADHVIASRMRGGSDELHGDVGKFIRMIGSDIITMSINYLLHADVTDSQNGFRAIKTSVIKQLNLQENGYGVEQEMLIKTLRKGFRVTEIASHEYARKNGHSNINIGKIWVHHVYSWLKYLLF
jgi:dolichol-phosphate mannosyltransferase